MDEILQMITDCITDERDTVRLEAVNGAGDSIEVLLDALAARRNDNAPLVASAAETQLDRIHHRLLEISRT